MADVLRCTDRWGREIVLTDECWNGHILPDRAILRGLESRLEVVLTDPYRVRRDATNPSRECFYRHRTLPGMPRLFLKVVVEFRPIGPNGVLDGSDITAFPTNHFKTGEQQIWP